jgi:hypothetical protein
MPQQFNYRYALEYYKNKNRIDYAYDIRYYQSQGLKI